MMIHKITPSVIVETFGHLTSWTNQSKFNKALKDVDVIISTKAILTLHCRYRCLVAIWVNVDVKIYLNKNVLICHP